MLQKSDEKRRQKVTKMATKKDQEMVKRDDGEKWRREMASRNGDDRCSQEMAIELLTRNCDRNGYNEW